jgi:D-arabinose 1-dehydrogenase-like Zn-dependent alcohol dehydrogenase
MEALCPQAQYGGYTANGGFAEYVVADARYSSHIPDQADIGCRRRSFARE